MDKIKVLFVCHGNICRSPMAEFVMKDLVEKAGRSDEFEIASAACTNDEIGNDMYPPAKKCLEEKGIPFTPRKARRITLEDYEYYDFIIGMDEENRRDLLKLSGGDPQMKISLLLSWAGLMHEVADPWYTGKFEKTYQDVLKGTKALLAHLGH